MVLLWALIGSAIGLLILCCVYLTVILISEILKVIRDIFTEFQKNSEKEVE